MSRSPIRVPVAVLASATFAAVALVTTGIVHASGREIVDTGVYREYGEAMRAGLVPYRDFAVEYPPGALPAFALPAFVASGEDGYFWAFASLMAVAGAVGVVLTSAALDRLGRPQSVTRGVLVLLALSPILFGGALLTRFDLIPAALVTGATLLLLADRPRGASLVLGIAGAVKVYPLALLPLVVAWTWRRHGRREATLAATLVVGVVLLAYLPFVVLAPEAVASSIWGQLSRPLQIESLGAGLLLLLQHAVDVDARIGWSHGSQNLTGWPAAVVAAALSAASLAALCFLWLRFARGEATPERLIRFGAAVLVVLVAFGKVLSPQFLVWLLFPLALVAGRRGAAAGAFYGFAAAATAIWFPWLYWRISSDHDPFVESLVALRGIALVGVFALLAWPLGNDRRPRPLARSAAGRLTQPASSA